MLHKNRVYTIFSTCLKLYLFIYRSSYLGLWLSLTAPTTRSAETGEAITLGMVQTTGLLRSVAALISRGEIGPRRRTGLALPPNGGIPR